MQQNSSSSGHSDSYGCKERVGILHLFDVVVTADEDDVKKGKPAPDIFLVAANRLGVAPEKCIGFEGK